MPFSMQESLANIDKLRTAAKKMESEGKKPDISSKTFDAMEMMVRNVNGDYTHGRLSVAESLTSTDVIKMIPKVIEGTLREAVEPTYLATNFFDVIHVDGNNTAVYVIPVVGELYAHEVGEGTRYQEESVDFNTVENGQLEVRVKKIGLKVKITEEAISDSSWDIYGINVRKMARAMGRYKEEWCFNSFSNHGTTVFDNLARTQVPTAGTTGRDKDGNYNDTMSIEDFLDLVMALMGNDMNPTDIIMHPLTWVIFAQNSMIGNGTTFGAFGGSNVHPWGATQGTPGFAGLAANEGPQKYILSPAQVQNRLPMPIQINFSPFIRFDKNAKLFDMYCIDRNNVGVIVQKENLQTDNWTDPERDLRLLKVKERYGIGITENGRGITVAKNLAVAPTYPVPPTVNVNIPVSETTNP